MKCFEENCDGEYCWKSIDYVRKLNSRNTIVVKNVWIQKCTVCGKEIFNSVASKQIENAIIEKYPDYFTKRPHPHGMNKKELNKFLNTPPNPSTKENPFGL